MKGRDELGWRGRLVSLGFGLSIVLLSACGSVAARSQALGESGVRSPSGPQEPLDIRVIVDRFVFDQPDLMCKAGLVADASVAALGPAHWNSADGSRAANLDREVALARGYQIVTTVRFSKFTVLIDRRHGPTLELAQVGGRVGQDQYWADGFPKLVPAQRYLVVFNAGLAGGVGITQSLLLVYDAFPIDRQQMVLLRPQVIEQGRISQQELKLPLTQIAQQLSACAK